MNHTPDNTDIVWIYFSNPSIGRCQRESLKHWYTKDIPSSWTPITKNSHRIFIHKKPFVWQQFLVEITFERTMHWSQGLTMDKLAFDLIGIQHHGLIYKTLSRVRNISSLYLLRHLHQSNFLVNNNVRVEMERLEK